MEPAAEAGAGGASPVGHGAQVNAHEPFSEAESFLREHVGAAIHLVSIVPDGATSGCYFGDDATAAARWAMAENEQGRNVYWTANVTAEGLKKKPNKSNIVAARFAHADIDPPKNGGAFDREAVLAQLAALDCPPSLVIDSGNGLQPLWRLDSLYGLDRSAREPWAPIEAINKAIEARFGADHCHNIDRLLRLPGTINYPNKKKRDAGRVPVLASLAHASEAAYSRDELASAFAAQEDAFARAHATGGADETFGDARHANGAAFDDIELLTADDLGLDAFSPIRSVIEHPAGKDRSADGMRCAGDILRAGFTRAQVMGVLLNPENKVSAHYLAQKDPRRAVLRTIERVSDASASEPLPLVAEQTPARPFPVDALGADMAAAAKAIAVIAQCPPALAAQSVLAAAALATQGHVDAMHPIGRAVPCSLLLITLAESGERKSTADKLALEGVVKAERDAEPDYRRAYADWRATCEANEAARAAAKRSKGGRDAIRAALAAVPADPAAPISPQRIVSDPNYEGLLRFMQTSHGSLAWFNNEAGQSIGGTAMHDDNRLKFGAGLSKFWDGQAVDRVRAGDGAHTLRGRRLTVHLMVQPGIARPLLTDPVLRAQGWLSRALVCEPPSLIGARPFREAGPEAGRALARFHARTRDLCEAPCPCADAANELAPASLALSAEARAVWVRFHDGVEASLGATGALADHRGFGAKLAENALRMAGVLAHYEGAREIGAEHMRRAVTLADYYAGEAVRISDGAAISVELAHAERVRRWLLERGEDRVRLREAMNGGPRPRDKRAMEAAFATLEAHGWVARDDGGYRIKGRDS